MYYPLKIILKFETELQIIMDEKNFLMQHQHPIPNSKIHNQKQIYEQLIIYKD